MERREFISLTELEFTLINGPLVVLNLTVNIFYACCLIFPPLNRQRLKQPLSLLLGFLVWCSIMFCVSLIALSLASTNNESFQKVALPYMIVLYFVDHSMTCYVWLNFYYYVNIVPVQSAPLTWVKRNIRSVICMFLVLDVTCFLLRRVIHILNGIILFNTVGTAINKTMIQDGRHLPVSDGILYLIVNVYIFICLCVMVLSSVSTVRYLHRQMKSAAQSGISFSAPRLQSQMRVTITGICQGVLYFLYCIYYFFDSEDKVSGKFIIASKISFTVTSLYISGTTVTLGIGQAVFRERVTSVWKALKALKTVDST